PVFCTDPTRDLCSVLLPDSGYLQEEDAAYANRKGYSKHHPALPLYTLKDGEVALRAFHTKPLHQPFAVNDLTFEFSSAGHILGATSVKVSNKQCSILFSGDLGRYDDLL